MTAYCNNVADFLLEGKSLEKTALLTITGQYTYGDLHSGAEKITAYIRRIGGEKGDRAILLSANGFFWVSAYLGILRAGLICVPLPESIAKENLDFIHHITGAKIAFLQVRVCQKMAASFSGCHVLTDRSAPGVSGLASQETFPELAELPAGTLAAAPVSNDDLAALMFTSGSTGQPRGVMVSHGNIIANTESIIQYMDLTERDRMMAVLPFHYCFGTSLLHTHLRAGGSLVLDSRFLYPETILQRMLETECTGFAGVPSHFQILLRASRLRSKQFPHLRLVQQAGGCLAPQFIRELREALPKTKVFVMYGQTEATARLSYLPPEFLDTKLGSIGKGIPAVRLRVVNELGEEVRPGETGEIVAEGENVTFGYWRAPVETAESFRDGKLYTGDLATTDSDGFIYIVGRKRNFLKCGGKRISIQEVENRLTEFPCITDAAVVAVPDDVLGEAVRAYVARRMPGCTDFDQCISAFYKEHLPRELYPHQIVALDRLPRNSAGKVRKSELE
jgi:long-chain acyl-CoA synthetase